MKKQILVQFPENEIDLVRIEIEGFGKVRFMAVPKWIGNKFLDIIGVKDEEVLDTENSLVDFLKFHKIDSSFENRNLLFNRFYPFEKYVGFMFQNKVLLENLKAYENAKQK